ncbi:MAG TPA: cellulose binding domain-containing protein [Streptosporangiaceae bacterium]
MDGARPSPSAGQDGGYVPPDLVPTQQLRIVGTAGRARPPVPPGPPVPAQPDVKVAPARPPRPPRKHRQSRNIAVAAACATGVVVIGAGVAVLWPGGGAKQSAAPAGRPAASAPARTQRGAPSPGGSAAGAAPGGAPFTRGRVVSYVTTLREPGYFEGLLTLTNRTGAALAGWQVSLAYPGAYVKSVWGGVLVRAGADAVIRGTGAAASIPPGGTVQVRFGAAGSPSAPRGCTLNGGPC